MSFFELTDATQARTQAPHHGHLYTHRHTLERERSVIVYVATEQLSETAQQKKRAKRESLTLKSSNFQKNRIESV